MEVEVDTPPAGEQDLFTYQVNTLNSSCDTSSNGCTRSTYNTVYKNSGGSAVSELIFSVQ